MTHPKRNGKPGRIWGYARVSDARKQGKAENPAVDATRANGDEDEIKQLDRLRTRAQEMIEAGEGRDFMLLQEAGSATRISYDQRPVFRQLMLDMQPGDTLLVWRLNRIDRTFFRMFSAAQFCVQRGVRLYLLDQPGLGEVDLSSATGRAFFAMGVIFADMWGETHRTEMREQIAWCKRHNRRWGPYPPVGCAFLTRRDARGRIIRKKNGDAVQFYEPCPDECLQLAELVARRRAGESMLSIANDWQRRRVTRACGLQWARPSRNHDKKVQFGGMSRAAVWAVAEAKQTGTIYGVPIPEPSFRAPSVARPDTAGAFPESPVVAATDLEVPPAPAPCISP